jgi:hypothetical protein
MHLGCQIGGELEETQREAIVTIRKNLTAHVVNRRCNYIDFQLDNRQKSDNFRKCRSVVRIEEGGSSRNSSQLPAN